MSEHSLEGSLRSTIDFLGNRWEYNCMGCAITNKEISIPGGIIFEGKYTILGADPEIPIPGFMIVNSKRHINSVSKLSKEERYEIIDVISLAEKALRELSITEEVTLVQEEKSKHLHIWIFPNYKWMTEKFGKGIKYLRDISEHAKNNVKDKDIKEIIEVIDKIREYFKEHSI